MNKSLLANCFSLHRIRENDDQQVVIRLTDPPCNLYLHTLYCNCLYTWSIGEHAICVFVIVFCLNGGTKTSV